ncbi:unnamed protein product [Mucor hiemalis]
MTSGKLIVTPLTIHGLPQNGYPNSQTFIGCYVSPSEKQRTNSANGPEPHFNDTLQCNVGENDSTLSIDVINEDPARPGLIGSGQLPLSSVFASGRFEDWVPLTTSSGSPLGYIFMKLNFTPSQSQENSQSQYRAPPPLPPAYQGQGSFEDNKTEVSDRSFPGAAPQRDNYSGSYNHNLSPPGYTPPPATTPDSYNASTPMSPGTPGSAQSPFMAVCPPGPTGPNGVPLTEKEKKKGVPDWVKYGGAALAGAAVVGVGSWAMGAYDGEEDEDVKRRNDVEAQKRAENEELYRSILARAREQRLSENSESQHYASREMVHEEPQEEEEEAEEEEQEEEKEEEEEQEEEEAEEYDRPVVNDSKWR